MKLPKINFRKPFGSMREGLKHSECSFQKCFGVGGEGVKEGFHRHVLVDSPKRVMGFSINVSATKCILGNRLKLPEDGSMVCPLLLLFLYWMEQR